MYVCLHICLTLSSGRYLCICFIVSMLVCQVVSDLKYVGEVRRHSIFERTVMAFLNSWGSGRCTLSWTQGSEDTLGMRAKASERLVTSRCSFDKPMISVTLHKLPAS